MSTRYVTRISYEEIQTLAIQNKDELIELCLMFDYVEKRGKFFSDKLVDEWFSKKIGGFKYGKASIDVNTKKIKTYVHIRFIPNHLQNDCLIYLLEQSLNAQDHSNKGYANYGDAPKLIISAATETQKLQIRENRINHVFHDVQVTVFRAIKEKEYVKTVDAEAELKATREKAEAELSLIQQQNEDLKCKYDISQRQIKNLLNRQPTNCFAINEKVGNYHIQPYTQMLGVSQYRQYVWATTDDGITQYQDLDHHCYIWKDKLRQITQHYKYLEPVGHNVWISDEYAE